MQRKSSKKKIQLQVYLLLWMVQKKAEEENHIYDMYMYVDDDN